MLYTAAFIAEIVRAGILAVPHGPVGGGAGARPAPGQVLRLIVLPQALRVIIPPMTSQYLNLTKNSSLAVAIGYQRTRRWSRPASAGLVVDYGGGAGQIGQAPDDTVSELIGLACALVLLLIMFGSIVAALIPLVGAIFSVGTGLALVGILAAATNLPTTAPTVATLLGLGVAVDYGLFLVARHREQLDHGMEMDDSIGKTTATSGAAVVVAGSTVVIAILGLYVSDVPFVGALGLASAIVVAVTMLSALTLVPAFLGLARGRVRSRGDRTAKTAAEIADADHTHENSAFARWGRKVSDRPWPWAVASARCWCCSRSRCCRCASASSTPAPTRPRRPTAAPTT